MSKVYTINCKDCDKEIKTITDPQGMNVSCGCKYRKEVRK